MEDNRKKNYSQPGDNGEAENHQRGRELHQRDQQRHQQNPSQQHRSDSRQWNPDHNSHNNQHGHHNQHQGRFPEDQYERNSNADRGASLSKHYGEREHSSYRNSNSLNYGDGRGNSTHQSGQQGGGTFAGSNQENQRPSNQYNQQHNQHNQHNQHQQHNQHNQLNRNQHNQHNSNYSSHGDGRGNYSARQDSYGQGHDNVHSDNKISAQRRMDDSNENYYKGAYMDSRGVKNELPRPDDNPYNEYPGSRSRYKDDDYRYGSGNHDWYEEQRYTDNNGRRVDRDKGDIAGEMGEGVRDAWNTMKHGVQNLFGRNSDHQDSDHNRHDHDNRRNDHEYRSRADRGAERGPRWSDETDSGDDDNSHYNRDNNPRYY